MQLSLGNVSCRDADARFWFSCGVTSALDRSSLQSAVRKSTQATAEKLIDRARADLASEGLEWDLSIHGSRDRR